MKFVLHCLLLLPIFLSACGPAASPPGSTGPNQSGNSHQTLVVFAAASLTDAFDEIGHTFEASHAGVNVTINFAGSQTLSVQLVQGAYADVFASANHIEMDKVVEDGLIAADAPVDFLTNRLVVILPPDNPAGIQSLVDLAKPGLKLVLADATVPAGKYARQSLDKMAADPAFGANFVEKVMVNVASNETDVKQVVTKVQLGEADAGIVYISDAVAAPGLKSIQIPENYNVIARYPVAALKASAQPGLAQEFITFILSSRGQAILEKWGFTPVKP